MKKIFSTLLFLGLTHQAFAFFGPKKCADKVVITPKGNTLLRYVSAEKDKTGSGNVRYARMAEDSGLKEDNFLAHHKSKNNYCYPLNDGQGDFARDNIKKIIETDLAPNLGIKTVDYQYKTFFPDKNLQCKPVLVQCANGKQTLLNYKKRGKAKDMRDEDTISTFSSYVGWKADSADDQYALTYPDKHHQNPKNKKDSNNHHLGCHPTVENREGGLGLLNMFKVCGYKKDSEQSLRPLISSLKVYDVQEVTS